MSDIEEQAKKAAEQIRNDQLLPSLTISSKSGHRLKSVGVVSLKEVEKMSDPTTLSQNIGEYLRLALLAKDPVQKKPFYMRFIDNYLREAVEDPSGYCGRSLGSGLFNEKMIETLSKTEATVYNDNIDFQIYKIRSTLYKEQQEVFDDVYDPTIMVICSRRAGKTELNARLAIRRLLKGEPVLYLNKTFANAVNQLYGVAEELIKKAGLRISSKSKVSGKIELSNGAGLFFAGMNDLPSLDKLRGGKYGLVIIDECGHIKNGDYLMDEVVTPMTADYAGSQVILTGTPPRVKNYATKLWHNKRIRHFHWVADVNPFIPDFQAHIDRVCEENGFLKDDGTPDYSIPFIQREYYGNMDAYDTEALVVPKYKEWHVDWSKVYSLGINKFIIGVDFGFVDFNAVVTIGFNDIEKKAYVFAANAFGNAGDDEIKNEIKKAYYDCLEYDLPIKIVTDTDQPGLASDLSIKEHLPVEKAYKYDLSTSIYETAGLLRTKVFIPDDPSNDEDLNANRRGKGNILKYEFERIVWERDEATDALTDKIDDTVFHPNAFHALRYALRNGIQFWSSESPVSNVEKATYNAMDILRQKEQEGMITSSYEESFVI